VAIVFEGVLIGLLSWFFSFKELVQVGMVFYCLGLLIKYFSFFRLRQLYPDMPYARRRQPRALLLRAHARGRAGARTRSPATW
jgi:hypothetical protein